MRRLDMDAEKRTMEEDQGNCDYEPSSKRFRRNSPGQEGKSSSKVDIDGTLRDATGESTAADVNTERQSHTKLNIEGESPKSLQIEKKGVVILQTENGPTIMGDKDEILQIKGGTHANAQFGSTSKARERSEELDSLETERGGDSEMFQNKEKDETDDSDDDSDNVSLLSNLSDSELKDQYDESSWQPVAGPVSWVQRQMAIGIDPRDVLKAQSEVELPDLDHLDQMDLWNVILNIMTEPKTRVKLPQVNTLKDAVKLLKTCKNIIVLTGAGVSVSCGIPDFRSRNGIYARLAKDFPDLPDPEAMFSIDYFQSDQRPFFKFAKEIYPGEFEPSPCHKFIKFLETQGKLLRNYTQNIDTLEKVAGIDRVVECHGSFARATCMACKYNVDADAIREDIFNQVIPRCPLCGPEVHNAVMKPDIVFFGESLPQSFHKQMAADKNECDLLIVIGSSLKVRPVALIPSAIPAHVPQILINRERLQNPQNFDVELLGDCDNIVGQLCKYLGDEWQHLASPGPMLRMMDFSDLPFVPCNPAPVEARVKGQEEVVEHSADSGMGEPDSGCAPHEPGGPAPSFSGGIPSADDGCGEPSGNRLERLGSVDSGSGSSAEIQGYSEVSLTSQSGSRTTQDPASAVASSSPVKPSVCNCSHVPCSSSVAKDSCDSSASKDSCDCGVAKDRSAAKDSLDSGIAKDSGDNTAAKDSGDVDQKLAEFKCDRAHEMGQKGDSAADSGHSTKSPQKADQSGVDSDTAQSSSLSSHQPCDSSSTKEGRSPCTCESGKEQEEDGSGAGVDQESSPCSHTDYTSCRDLPVKKSRERLRFTSNVIEKDQFVFLPPSVHIFQGADVFISNSDSDSDSDSD